MADDLHSFRTPKWLWKAHGEVVGDVGRAPDLKEFMSWRIDNPGVPLGPDVDLPYEITPSVRVHPDLWTPFAGCVADGDCSAELRRYMNWRVAHPREPLPGRRRGPLRRQSRPVACV